MKTTLVAVIQQIRARALDLASDLDAVAAEVTRERALLERLTGQLQEVLAGGAAAPTSTATAAPAPAPEPPAPPAPPSTETPEAGRATAAPARRPARGAAPDAPAFHRRGGKKQGAELVWEYLQRHPQRRLTTAQLAKATGVTYDATNIACVGFRKRGFISGDGSGWSLVTSPPAPPAQPARAPGRGGKVEQDPPAAERGTPTETPPTPPAPPPVEASEDDDEPEDEPPARSGAAIELLEQDEDEPAPADDLEEVAKLGQFGTGHRPGRPARAPNRREKLETEQRLRSGRPLIPAGGDRQGGGPPVIEQRTKVPVNKHEVRW